MATFLSILLLILKIIGILLLVILALLCVILLVPVRYGFELSAPEKEEISVKADVGWLLHLINGRVSYLEKKLSYDVRILGIRLISNDPEYLEKKKQKSLDKEKKKQEKASLKEGETVNPPSELSVHKEEEIPREEPEMITDTQPAEVSEGKEDLQPPVEYHPARYYEKDKKDSQERKTDTEEEKPSVSERITGILDRMKGIGDRISGIIDKAEDLKNTLEEYQIMELLKIGKDALLDILHHILPYSLKGWIRYGFDDPSLTGYVAGVGAVFYPRYYKSFSLEPDFQRVCFAGYCKGKGRIRPGFFLILLIKLLLKKEVRKLLHLLLK